MSEIRANVPGKFSDIRFRDVRIDRGVAVENADGVTFADGAFSRVGQTAAEKAAWEADFRRVSNRFWFR